MQEDKNYSGVTLIELLIVIAIIGIMSAITWGILGESKKDVELENACNQVASSINKARGYALSGKNSSGSTGVAIKSDTVTSYEITGIGTAETTVLPRGVTFSTALDLSFSVPGGAMTTGGGLVPSTPFPVRLGYSSKTRSVTVDAFKAECK